MNVEVEAETIAHFLDDRAERAFSALDIAEEFELGPGETEFFAERG